jgi:hypothetical protein
MPNNIDIKLNSKDLPATAVAVNSAALLQIILVFVSFWGVVAMLGNAMKSLGPAAQQAEASVAVYDRAYSVAYTECSKSNVNGGKPIYNSDGLIVGQYPLANCIGDAQRAAKLAQLASKSI